MQGEVGGPKCIIFDVDGDVPDIRMTTEELAEENIQARMDALADPLRTKVAEAIKRLMPGSLPTGSKSDSD